MREEITGASIKFGNDFHNSYSSPSTKNLRKAYQPANLKGRNSLGDIGLDWLKVLKLNLNK
jgi:hypothetical protein